MSTIRSRWVLLVGAVLALGALPATAEDAAPAAPAAPAPAAAKATRWELKFGHGPLRRAVVDDGTGRETTYLYMTMTVENGTELPRDWRPLVTAKVDTRPDPYVAGGYAMALAVIRRLESNDDLQPLDASGWKGGDDGKLAVGAKKNLVAIFGPVDPGWASFRIEVYGLVNPITTLKVEKYGDQQIVLEAAYAERNAKVREALRAAAKASGSEIPAPVDEYQEVLEKRARVIEYRRSGDEFRPDDDLIEKKGEDRWEIIGDPKVIRVIKPAA